MGFSTFRTQIHYGCDTVVIMGNKKLAKEWLGEIWLNDRNNGIVDAYMKYRHDQISVAQKLHEGRADGAVFVMNLDDCFVLETEKDLFYFSLTDDEWLEEVSKESCNEIAAWLEDRGINYTVEEGE